MKLLQPHRVHETKPHFKCNEAIKTLYYFEIAKMKTN